jgi:hypothetical protein
MTLIALVIGLILIVSAFRGTSGQLFSALGTDVPAYGIWAAAIVAVGVIGFVPGLKPVSRGLLALVLVVIILNNYQNILNNFASLSSSSSPAVQGGASPASSNSASNAPDAGLGAGDVTGNIADLLGQPAVDAAFNSAFGSTQ